MQRRLIVMRHAKSAFPTDASGDHARPLDDRGRREASMVAAELFDRGWVPDLVLSSDATRTRETWARMTDVLGDPPLTTSRALYHAGVDSFCEEVGLVEPTVGCLLALGHNPGWEEVSFWLTGQEIALTTANAALLAGTGPSWADALRPRAWALVDILRPKEL